MTSQQEDLEKKLSALQKDLINSHNLHRNEYLNIPILAILKPSQVSDNVDYNKPLDQQESIVLFDQRQLYNFEKLIKRSEAILSLLKTKLSTFRSEISALRQEIGGRKEEQSEKETELKQIQYTKFGQLVSLDKLEAFLVNPEIENRK